MKLFIQKPMRLILLLVLFAPLVSKSQIRRVYHIADDDKNNAQSSFPDSIRVDFPDERVFVLFQVSDYMKEYTFVESFGFILPELIRYIRQGSVDTDFASTPHQARVILKEGGEKEIQLSPVNNATTRLLIKGDQVVELLPPGWEIAIEGNDSKAYVYGKDLGSIEKMIKFDFRKVVDKINSHQENPIGKRNISARMIVKNGDVTQSEVDLKHPGSLLVFLPSVGLGALSNGRFYPEIGVAAAAIFQGHSGRESTMIKLGVDYRFNLSTMLSFSYGWNMAKNGASRWLAPGIGVFKGTDDGIYNGNNVRVFISYDIKNNISLVPEFFLPSRLRDSVFGLKLNYTLP